MTASSKNNAQHDLTGRTVAVLATDGFEESELTSPVAALKAAGATVRIVSIGSTALTIRGWAEHDWAEDSITVDGTVPEMKAADFDALMIPGGVMNPDKLRANADAVSFVKDFFTAGKPVAAICHGPWLLVEAGVVNGRKLTSYASIRTDLMNAGANWVDEEVVVDQGLVTSRSPEDLPAFNAKMVEEIFEGVHEGQHA